MTGGEREAHHDGGAPPFAGAQRGDVSPVQLDEMTHDGEPQAEPAAGPLRRRVRLPEALEHVGQEPRRDALPAVAHAHLHVRVHAAQVHLDVAAARRELDGVREQVPDHLLEPFGVGEHPAGRRVDEPGERDRLRLRRGRERVGRRLDDGSQLEGTAVELQLARHDAGDVEQVVNEPRLGLGVPVDRLDGPRRSLRVECLPAQHPEPGEHRAERGTQLV